MWVKPYMSAASKKDAALTSSMMCAQKPDYFPAPTREIKEDLYLTSVMYGIYGERCSIKLMCKQ
jgi:hypothetical protein